MSVMICTSSESTDTDVGLATAFLPEGDSSHSQFDKALLQTHVALGMQALMSLLSIFLPAMAVAASCTLDCIRDSRLLQLHFC